MQHSGSAYRQTRDWQQEEIFSTGEDFFASMLDGIAQAQHSINMVFYIFENDVLGQQVMQALISAARRQVKIHLMIDGLGSMYDARKIASQLSAANIDVHIFHPFPLALNVFRWSLEQGNTVQKFLHFLTSINHRNHHKLCIIDDKYLWTGSFNISARHLDKANGGSGWHDYGVKVTDPHVQGIQHSFYPVSGQSRPGTRKLYLQKLRLNITATLRRISNTLLIKRISQAQQRLWIINAYFSPSHKVLRAIKKARRNGVDVHIILPASSDVFFMPLLSRTYYKRLLRQGVHIYEYQPAILHAKMLLIDQKCIIGSTNLNHRSFLHDLELDIVLSQPASIARVEELLLADMQASREITLAEISKHSTSLFFARILRLFRHWL